MNKPFILCIVGSAGSGKTTVAKYIADNYSMPYIKSYTDRTKRDEELHEPGEFIEMDHTFVSKSAFSAIMESNEMIAYTDYGGKRYMALRDQLYEKNVYVIDENGIRDMQSKYKDDFNIATLYINANLECDDLDRVKRDEERKTIPEDFYDFIIVNSKGDFDNTTIQIESMMKEIYEDFI